MFSVFSPILRVPSECIPSSPDLIVKTPPKISASPFEWIESSAESIVKVPPFMIREVPAFSPLVLSDVSSVDVVSSVVILARLFGSESELMPDLKLSPKSS